MMVIFPLFFYIVRKIINPIYQMATVTELLLATVICLLFALIYLLLYELNTIILSQQDKIEDLEEKVKSWKDYGRMLYSHSYHLRRRDRNAEA